MLTLIQRRRPCRHESAWTYPSPWGSCSEKSFVVNGQPWAIRLHSAILSVTPGSETRIRRGHSDGELAIALGNRTAIRYLKDHVMGDTALQVWPCEPGSHRSLTCPEKQNQDDGVRPSKPDASRAPRPEPVTTASASHHGQRQSPPPAPVQLRAGQIGRDGTLFVWDDQCSRACNVREIGVRRVQPCDLSPVSDLEFGGRACHAPISIPRLPSASNCYTACYSTPKKRNGSFPSLPHTMGSLLCSRCRSLLALLPRLQKMWPVDVNCANAGRVYAWRHRCKKATGRFLRQSDASPSLPERRYIQSTE